MVDQPETTAPDNTGLKIIGAGFGRTGTLSLKTALNELGFGPCYHMTEVFQHPDHNELWLAAARGEQVNWNDILGEYQSTVDWPGCAFYKELMRAYPDAKVLLTVRDPERWYESVNSTIYRVSRSKTFSPASSIASFLMRRFIPVSRVHLQMIGTIIWKDTFHGKFEDKAYALSVFNRHNEEVKKVVPAEKLLVYDVKEGWGPLCSFLGVDVPKDTPFPHLNDRDSFVGTQRRRQLERGINVAIIACLVVTLLLFRRLLPVPRVSRK